MYVIARVDRQTDPTSQNSEIVVDLEMEIKPCAQFDDKDSKMHP